MRYRNNRYPERLSKGKPQPRDMVIKYAGQCVCCGATIAAGTFATYYPAGTLACRTTGAIGHIGGLDGNSQACFVELKKRQQDPGFVDLDRAYEDQCADICGR